ncbi:oligogalacturonide transporter [Pullulanibacillus pueri]|uniref:MFS transporter n=1 Tax=Pullulanibacillus pueri TaxID=1437324 RepID=A0A8J2ZX65_9BACL|nr:MFS transporter [Pullulanibacillus pueri]MBM7682605.1 oligogalacturonide transporter [Pullulanibacillus pueri]GGH82477.1 MFS transporter [Pullulanibacillus pueri]
MSRKNKNITLRTSIGYGLTDMVGGGAFTIIGAWLLFFYTTFCDLTPVEAGSIIAIARIVDAVASLSMGSLSDHFFKNKLGRKFGRRRFFILIGSPLMLVYILLWTSGMNYWYYLLTYLLFEIIAAMILIPWETLPSEMTEDFNKRTKLSTTRMFISSAGTFLATFVPGQLINALGKDNAMAFFVNGAFFAVVFAICVFISYKSTWERELSSEDQQKLLEEMKAQRGFKEKLHQLSQTIIDYGTTFKIKSFRKHLFIYICSMTAKDTFNAVFVFFCVFALNSSSAVAANMLSLSIIGIPCTIAYGFLMIKIGPANLFKVSFSTMILCLLAYGAVFLIQPHSLIVTLFIISAVYQIGRSMLEFTPWNVYPFIPDVDEMVSKQRREGLFAAVMTFFRKSSTALATFLVGVVLQFGGFVEGADTQSTHAVHTIVYVLVIGVGALLLLSLIAAFTFKLNKETHGILVDEIHRLKNNGSKQQVDPKTKEVVEALTGYKYENLWGGPTNGTPTQGQEIKSS